MNVSSVSGATDAAHRAASEVAPWLERLARLGFAAKALLYMTVGALAASAALGFGGRTTDSHGAMAVLNAKLGRVLVIVIAIGLAGYAVWRIVEGIADPEHRGRGAKGIVLRLRSVATGVIHGGLAASAVKLAMGLGREESMATKSQHWTRVALSSTSGRLALWIVAAGFIAYGGYQLYCAAKAKLSEHLALGRLKSPARRWVIGASRFGIAARGIVFGMIGILFARAVQHRNPNEAGSVDKSLRELIGLGRWPFVAIAVGLIAYGVYQLLNARYRRILVR